MKKLRSIVAIPGDTMYLREQVAAAQATAARLGLELEVVSANMDAVGQGQQLLKYVQAREDLRPDAILLEPVSAAGLPRVAEAAVAAGIGWVVSNASVDYIGALRAKAKAPVFLVSQDHIAIGRLQGQQIGALLPAGGSVFYLRGPGMSAIASRRFEGIDSGKPKNVELKALKVQGASVEDAYRAVCSWLSLSTGRPEAINFMAKFGRGLICLAMTEQRCDALALAPITPRNTSMFGTPFCEPIDARRGTTTGTSAADRATTILAATDPNTRPEDLARPGHVYTLRARNGGVLVRAGQTEACVDLAARRGANLETDAG